MDRQISKSGHDITPLDRKHVEELAAKLDPEAFRVTQKAGTEAPFCGGLLNNKGEGTYACIVCGLPLFAAAHKFDSGTGWPSFYKEVDSQHVARHADRAHGMVRVEINCARCGAHLGHVFDDGPAPTGERHCLNSASLKFVSAGSRETGQLTPGAIGQHGQAEYHLSVPPNVPPAVPRAAGAMGIASAPSATTAKLEAETAYFAAGCFWGVEHYLQQGQGVITAESGYMQGRTDNPTYEQVCSGATGHAETVKVVFDPGCISFRRLLQAFFDMHNPTQRDRQGPDVGTQYRSGIWYTTPEQQRLSDEFIAQLGAAGRFNGKPIVTQVEPARKFWPAEDYHQDYVVRTGRACHVANPWKTESTKVQR